MWGVTSIITLRQAWAEYKGKIEQFFVKKPHNYVRFETELCTDRVGVYAPESTGQLVDSGAYTLPVSVSKKYKLYMCKFKSGFHAFKRHIRR